MNVSVAATSVHGVAGAAAFGNAASGSANAAAVAISRLERVRAYMHTHTLDALYVRNESDIFWITAFDNVFDGEGAFSLFITQEQAILHTDSRYEFATRSAVHNTPFTLDVSKVSHAVCALSACNELFAPHVSNQPTSCTHTTQQPTSCTHTTQQPAPCVRIGIETTLELGEYRELQQEAHKLGHLGEHVQFVETTQVLLNMRAVKDATELRRLRVAQAITDAAFAHICTYVRPSISERAVQCELEHYMLCHGASALAFSSIVAAGAHGASAHAIAGDTPLESGQCVVFDFGAKKNGYCSDMTRMVFLGEPSQEMRHAYAVLREANETVQAHLRAGVTGAAAHQEALGVLSAGGFAGTMGHGLGHGVGIDIHEQPLLSPRNTCPLVEGSVVTVEPGIYLEGKFGMRLEDCGVITHAGFEAFAQTSHEMVII